MRPVYDEFRAGFTVRIRIWAAISGFAEGLFSLLLRGIRGSLVAYMERGGIRVLTAE
jgi:hypothetical protein